MALLFYGTSAANGFDSLGHYVRDQLLVSDCTGYATSPVPGCSARFGSSAASNDVAATDGEPREHRGLPKGSQSLLKAALAGAAVARQFGAPLTGLLDYLIGPAQMSPRRDRSPLGSPILIGALTVLAVIVAVFLAYHANNGFPFVPSYSLHVQVADASELTHGAEVHMGGALVGFVDSVQPTRTADGQPIAVLGLKLNKSIGRLPVDSTFTIRLKGSIGQKYLAIGPGQIARERTRTGRRCRCARPPPPSTSTRFSRCSIRPPARASSPRPSASATAWPGAG